MSASNQPSVKTIEGYPAPQYYNDVLDKYEAITGEYGANRFIERGRIVKDAFSGNANVTKTYVEPKYGLSVVNDATTDLTVSINGFTIVLKAGESFDDLFDAFTSFTITATGDYRTVVRA